MLDRRKHWQKAANIKWARCGHMLADTARDLAKPYGRSANLDDYAKALGISNNEARERVNAQIARQTVSGLILGRSGLSPEERRKQGRKIINRIRAQIDKRCIGGRGPNLTTLDAYAKALGISNNEARERVNAQHKHLSEVLTVVSYRPDATEQPAPMAAAA